MKRILAAVLILLLTAGCSVRPRQTVPASTTEPGTAPATAAATVPTTAPTTAPTLSPDEITDMEFRPAYGQGNCQRLSGDTVTLVFLMSDSVSGWTKEQGEEFMQSAVLPGLEYLEKAAWEWGVELRTRGVLYGGGDGYTLRYPGTYDPSLESAVQQYDLPDVLAECLGFEDRNEMDGYFRDSYGVEEVMYLAAFNCRGTSYTMPDNYGGDADQIEYTVLFCRYGNDTPVSAFTVAHEIMHLYGAEDYYDPYGDLPRRKALTEQRYPDDLMLRWDADVNNLTVSDVTAYTVGWTDQIPEVLYWPEWWS